MVGVPVRSQYLPDVATEHKSSGWTAVSALPHWVDVANSHTLCVTISQ